MKYNTDLHNRRSVRLRSHDYARAGAYFVTICCQDRINYFGEIVNDEIAFNEYGDVAYKEWKKLSERYPGIAFDIFQIMPNHIHGVIEIHNTNVVGATFTVAPNPNTVAPNPNTVAPDTPDAVAAPGVTVAPGATVKVAPTDVVTAVTVGRIVGAYKSLVFKKCLKISNLKNCILGRLWQRNYYEHIIRNEIEYARISEYIQNNPILWKKRHLNTIL